MLSWLVVCLLYLRCGVEKVEGKWINVMEIFVFPKLRRRFCYKTKEDLWAG